MSFNIHGTGSLRGFSFSMLLFIKYLLRSIFRIVNLLYTSSVVGSFSACMYSCINMFDCVFEIILGICERNSLFIVSVDNILKKEKKHKLNTSVVRSCLIYSQPVSSTITKGHLQRLLWLILILLILLTK